MRILIILLLATFAYAQYPDYGAKRVKGETLILTSDLNLLLDPGAEMGLSKGNFSYNGIISQPDEQVVDYSGNGHNGTCYNDLGADQYTGYYSWDFNGTDHYINFGDVCDLDTSAFIIFFWAKVDTMAAGEIFTVFNKDPDNVIFWTVGWQASGKVYADFDDNVIKKTVITPLDIYDDNQWHFWNIVNDGSYFRIYVDGNTSSLVALPISGGTLSNTANLTIGRWDRVANYFFKGSLGLSGI